MELSLTNSASLRCKETHTSWTADPNVEVVVEPPCVGPGGSEESPNSDVIFFDGMPITFAATCVIAVAVPAPMSLTALCTSKVPSTFNLADALAVPREAPNTPDPIP